MKHREVQSLYYQFVSDGLVLSLGDRLREHLRQCEECRELFEANDKLLIRIDRLADIEFERREDLSKSVMERISILGPGNSPRQILSPWIPLTLAVSLCSLLLVSIDQLPRNDPPGGDYSAGVAAGGGGFGVGGDPIRAQSSNSAIVLISIWCVVCIAVMLLGLRILFKRR